MNKQKLAILLVLLVLIPLVLIGLNGMRTKEIKSVNVHIKNSKELFFVKEVEVNRILQKYLGRPVKGLPLRSINLNAIEGELMKNPWVEKAEVHSDFNGRLNIQIDQKDPLVRIQNTTGSSYYISKGGSRFPLSSQFTAHVPVATGKIDSAVSRKVYTLMTFVHESPFWNGQVQQIFVRSKNNLFIVPAIGNHVVEVGDTDRLDEKFRHLEEFYRQVIPKVGWNKYKEVSIRYKGQVIGRKS